MLFMRSFPGATDPKTALETMQSNIEAGIEKIRARYKKRVGI